MFRIYLILLLISTTPSLVLAVEKGEAEYNSGVKSFKLKKYSTALSYFKKAASKGMTKNTLVFNIGVTYYKLGDYKKAENNFKRLLVDTNFRQISFYNLGLIAEKLKRQKNAISRYSKAVSINTDSKITQLANLQLDKLLNRKSVKNNKNKARVRLSFGNDDNITTTASNSPSNKSDNYLELYASIKAPVKNNVNLNAAFYSLDYSTFSANNYMFYSAGFDYSIKTLDWKIIPAINIIQSTLNNSSYQSVLDLKVSANKKLSQSSRVFLRYRHSNISSQNVLYDYLQGTRHQIRAEYMNRTELGKLRLRYQLELNDRQNTLLTNYSPTRHEFRARLKQTLKNNWGMSEEINYRLSNYDAASGITRNDSRLRLQFSALKKVKKNIHTGVRYTYTSNNSNIVSEEYTKNNIQVFADWKF